MALGFILTLGIAGLAPLVIALIHRAVSSHQTRVWTIIVGYAWAAVWLGLFALFGVNGAWLGCEADGEPGAVMCTRGEEQCDPNYDARCRPEGAWCPPGPASESEAWCAPSWTPRFLYCEQFSSGWVAQPQSTWSDLAFVVSGLVILLWVSIEGGRTRRRTDNPFRYPSLYSVAYGLIAIFMGPASMFLHASMKSWAGWFDNYSILLWLGFCGMYTTMRAARWRGTAADVFFALLYAAIMVGLGVFSALVGFRDIMVYVLGAAWGTAEIVFLIVSHTQRRQGRTEGWIIATVGALVAAFVFWGLWQAGGPGCDPAGAFQGHAWWHVLAALATFFSFLYFRSEEDISR